MRVARGFVHLLGVGMRIADRLQHVARSLGVGAVVAWAVLGCKNNTITSVNEQADAGNWHGGRRRYVRGQR